MEEPLIPGVIGAAVLALLGLLGWRARQRHRATAVDSSFLESRLQPDSFFGASGGQRVDTNEGTATGSSMVYSPSQLDAAGDVDPVAEADVYLAYGRDLQAEEILKEALRINPQRVAIHVKLLEIYAKRRDPKAFEQVAAEAYSLTHGEGGEWARICELGQELDPTNPMYKPGGQPGAAPVASAATGSALPPADPAFLNTTKQPVVAPAAASAAAAVDLDLDLDFSLGDEPAPAASSPAPAAKAAPAPAAKPEAPAMDFSTQPVQLDAPSLTLPDNSLDFTPEPPVAPAPAPARAAAAPAPAADAGMIEFNLGDLSLDLDSSAKPAAPAPAPVRAAAAEPMAPALPDEPAFISAEEVDSADPLATKLALAEEFNAIGDADGARSLAQEVIAEASGDLKSKAQKFLAEIG
ncbi:MAG TPA: FimV/HubP family polar landmark protein [Ramlibacter sp.]